MQELTGYADPWSAAPGDLVNVMVSTDSEHFDARVVRLIHGDTNPNGPGFKVAPVETDLTGRYPGRIQAVEAGSYVRINEAQVLNQLNQITLFAWIWPTMPSSGRVQGVLSRWSPSGPTGFRLVVGPEGRLEFRVADGSGAIGVVELSKPLEPSEWYLVGATFDATTGRIAVFQELCSVPVVDEARDRAEAATTASDTGSSDAPVLIAAGGLESSARGDSRATQHFNGKVDGPRIYASAFDGQDLALLERLGGLAGEQDRLIAAWDFGRDFSSRHIQDGGPNGLHGVAMNMPARAMTGPNWTGFEVDFKHAPAQYGAIHFHEDDLDDAEWKSDLSFRIPDGFASGVYAVQIATSDREDFIPFFVRPPRNRATAPIAYLLPTLTYLAYANERLQWATDINYPEYTDLAIEPELADLYLRQHPEFGLSVYDLHRDKSGCCYSSRRRPIPNMRPNYRYWLNGAPRHFSADLYLIDWMEEKGFEYDVITDEDLHHDGFALLQRYQVVITGSHPEYWTLQMRIGLEEYLASTGRCMYLGGNGFYWVTSIDPAREHVMEVRRGQAGSRSWESAPGESYHSATGELGGLWRHRGKTPNSLVGVGFIAQGSSVTSPGYTRLPDSFKPEASFVFEGIDDDAVIGDFGLVMGGAAGDELDSVACAWCPRGGGPPRHTLVLATSAGKHNDYYLLVHEEFLITENRAGGSVNPKVRADMAYFATPRGGGVFSVGSINWMGSLSHKRYDNNVSRVTENVLRRFLDPEPLNSSSRGPARRHSH